MVCSYDQCLSDADCTRPGAPSGTCTSSMVCSYDECLSDSDCGGSSVCTCVGPENRGVFGNTCTQAMCHVDADCGPGGYCSPSQAGYISGQPVVGGWFCHGCNDACIDDSDCPPPFCLSFCAFNQPQGKWLCAQGC